MESGRCSDRGCPTAQVGKCLGRGIEALLPRRDWNLGRQKASSCCTRYRVSIDTTHDELFEAAMVLGFCCQVLEIRNAVVRRWNGHEMTAPKSSSWNALQGVECIKEDVCR